jgi:hypothetical protein
VRHQLQFVPPYPTVTITPYDQIHSFGVQLGQTAPTDTLWPAVSRAIFLPFVLYRPVTAYGMFIHNGSVVSGNVDLGIYAHTGHKIVTTGSTAQAGVSDLQEISFASPTPLGPGYYFMAISIDNTTARVLRRALGGPEHEAAGGYQDAGEHPLPDLATFGTVSSSYIPLMGVRVYA